MQALQITEASTSTQDERTVESAVSLVEECKEVARVFSKSLTAATDAIDDLNPKLKRKIENARKSFFNHVDWLSRWSKKGQKGRLDKMVPKIKNRLKKLANAVKDKIKQEVHTVVELLKKRVREIKMKLEGITASLEEYVEELGQWMGDAKKYIKDVKKYVNDIMDQLDGEHRKKIDQAAADIDSQLGKKVEELNVWIEDAHEAVNVAKKKADDVYEKLNHGDDQQLIGSGIKQIKHAKQKVEAVGGGLKSVNEDLRKWREAAKAVLDIAVKRAEDVHEKLDPTKNDDSHVIGKNIKDIGDANNDIQEANTALGQQVVSLNTWINEAEKIRAAAETKAREAYDKLSVHEKLSENVKRIVDAKDRIANVHRAVDAKVKELGAWRNTAEKVLEGAVQKAEEVYNALKDNVYENINEIDKDNYAIKAASENLAKEVADLGNWKTAAGKVIAKAEEKCDEILKRVDKSHKENDGGKKGPVILQEASKLKDQGIKLINAAKDAKHTVEQRVKDALDAVKAMDADLKRDLKVVKDKIKEGIKEVISDLQVGTLGDKVREDLKALRERITGLKENGKLDGIVRELLEHIKEHKKSLDQQTSQIKEQKLKEMEQNFRSHIKDPLKKNLSAVNEAIGKLYEKFNPNGSATAADNKLLQKIFEHIKQEVAKIKGSEGGKTGLDGIEKGLVNSYAGGFKGEKFKEIVKGWVSASILKFNGLVWDKMNWSAEPNEKAVGDIAAGVSDKLTKEIDKGKEAFNNGAQGTGGEITQTLTKVKEACETFADELDGKKTESVRGQVDGIVSKVNEVSEIKGKGGRNSLTAAEAVLCALPTASRQVSKEIDSIMLGNYRVGTPPKTSIAAELDRVIGVTKDLDGKLGRATQTSDDGTAQAVDNAIDGVSNEVKGLDTKFQQKVKKPVEDAVNQLEPAVKEYDEQAKEQVKKAATEAIEQAAKEISENENVELSDVKSKMENFNGAYSPIKDGLVSKLRDKVEEQLPGSIVSSDRVRMEGTNFKKYRVHFTPVGPFSHNDPTGNVPKAINSITSDGLKALNEGDVPKIVKSGDSTFTDRFKAIEAELHEIKKLVDGKESSFFPEPRDKGIKTLFEDLKKGLATTSLGTAKGLSVIEKAVEKLHEQTFGPKADEIGKAVEAIKLQVDELKKKLLNGTEPKGVIDTLKGLKDAGLESGKWGGKDGRQVDGIQKIYEELQEQNKKLPVETKNIEQAMILINRELRRIGFKLHHDYAYDDITDQMGKLRKHIGNVKGQYKNNLMGILTVLVACNPLILQGILKKLMTPVN